MAVDPSFEKELAELIDGDSWILADRLADQFPVEEFGDGSSANSGLYALLDEYSNALREDYGIKFARSTMRAYRATAFAWPRDRRLARAPFDAHRFLNTVDGRDKILVRLTKQNRGRVTVQDVRNWRRDQNPPPLESWEAKVERYLRQAIRRADPWAPEAKAYVADRLEALARELRASE